MPFEPNKIAVAMMKAFLAVHGTQGAASASVRETVDGLTQAVMRALVRSRPGGGTFHIEDVQDQVELGLMRGGHHEIARAYVLYRERRTQERAKQAQQEAPAGAARCTCSTAASASRSTWTTCKAPDRIGLRRPGRRRQARPDRGRDHAQPVRRRADRRGLQGLHPGRPHADREGPRLHLRHRAPAAAHHLQGSARPRSRRRPRWPQRYADYFPQFIKKGVDNELLDEKLLQFDLKRLGAALKAERDLKFDYLGLQTLYDRYFLHVRKTRIELPQAFFMRVAMGLSLNEIDREARAIEFYEVLSSLRLHVEHADAVQRRHAALAAVVAAT